MASYSFLLLPTGFRPLLFLNAMHTWKFDSGDYLNSMLLDRCSHKQLSGSSDDDSADSGCWLPWVDESAFVDPGLDAYLQDDPTGWSLRCECGDNKLSLCSFCLQNSTDSFFSLPSDDVNRWVKVENSFSGRFSDFLCIAGETVIETVINAHLTI